MDPTYKGLPTPVPTKIARSGLNWKLILIIAGGFLVVITVLGLIFARGSSSDSLPRLGYKLDNFTALMNSTAPSIKDDALKKTNAELMLVIDGDRATLKDILPDAKNDKDLTAIKTEEAVKLAEHKNTLKTALASGGHDTAYRKLLQDELQSLFSLAETVDKESSSAKTRQLVTTVQEHLTFYFNQLDQN